jgi:RNA polymerase sigma factor (TIGR02999 family)
MASLRPDWNNSDGSITALLTQLGEGKREAEARLIPQIYQELRRVAGHYMRHERVNHTLQPTALVHEAYTRLVQERQITWQSRAHFFATASKLMRHILVDHARARHADKRGGIQHQVTLDAAILPAREHSLDVLAVHEALERLTTLDRRQGRIVELHFFGGLSLDEIASVLHISERTVKRDWRMARAWLRNELSKRA